MREQVRTEGLAEPKTRKNGNEERGREAIFLVNGDRGGAEKKRERDHREETKKTKRKGGVMGDERMKKMQDDAEQKRDGKKRERKKKRRVRQAISKRQQICICNFSSKIEMKKTMAAIIPTEVMDFKSI